jgi:hypothetical protein
MRKLALFVAWPFLCAFGPGNCAPDVGFRAEAAAEGQTLVASITDAYTITVPRGVAVALRCDDGCHALTVSSDDPDIVYAGPSIPRNASATRVAVIVGREVGEAEVAVGVGDLGYTFKVRVTEPPVDASAQAMRVIELRAPELRRR